MSTRQTAKQREQQILTEANGFDYLLHSAGVGVLLYSTGPTIQQPAIGLFFTFTAWVGLLISFLVRRLASNSTWGLSFSLISGWLQLGIAILVLVNLKTLNQLLPGEVLSLELYPMAFLAWFIALGAFLLWSDGTLYFQSVPGIALFGLLSWLETSVYFEIAIMLYTVIIAVLLTRLHTRAMHARAAVVGFRDLSQLRRNQWRGMAGPGLAIFSVLVVAGVSKVAAPYLGGAIRTIVGSPLVPTTPQRTDSALFLSFNVHRVIGTGPRSSSRLPILRVRVEGPVQYLRAGVYDHYTGIGWREPSSHAIELPPVSDSPRVQSEGARVYRVENPFGILEAPLVRADVESLGRSHSFAYTPGIPIRIEYNGNVSVVNGEFLAFGDAFPSGKSYSVWAIGFPSLSPEMRSAGVSQRAENQGYYERNNQIAPEVQRLAINVIQNTTSDYDAAMAITREVGRRCRYNLKAPALRGREDRVKQFLFETQEGYCDLFASAVTIMCRSVGLRSRIAYGYILDPETMRDGWYTVEDRHAHIWSEVYLEGYGWVPFDATAYAESVPGGGVGDVLETVGENSILRWAGAIALILFGGSFAILVGVSAISWWRTRRRVLPAYRALRPLYLYYLKELQRALRRPKRASETTREYAIAFAGVFQDGKAVIEVAEMFDEAFYAQIEPTEVQILSLKQKLRILPKTAKRWFSSK